MPIARMELTRSIDAAREFPSESVVGLVGTVFCSI